jgi:sialate O-acetylesterase
MFAPDIFAGNEIPACKLSIKTTPNHFMKKLLILVAICAISWQSNGKVSLPKIFSDHMVVQRDQKVKIWGWADKSESISVTVAGVTLNTKADKAGNWQILFDPLKPGGPYEIVVSGKDLKIILKDVLCGDVWVGSGQSNMEWTLKDTRDAEVEISNSYYPTIRLFTVPKAMSFAVVRDLAGGQWLECTPKNAADFSAVAYYFGRKLNEDLDIPIGLINTSWGGTNIQAWLSWDVMSKKEAYKSADIAALQEKAAGHAEKQKKYEEALKVEKGNTQRWYEETTSENWKKIQVPKVWEATEIGNADGYVWFRKDFELTADVVGKSAMISLGPIDDVDETYLNGVLIGKTNEWNKNRWYQVKEKLLKNKNTLIIRVLDTGGGGGIYGKPEDLFLEVDQNKIPLAGEWIYRPSVLTTDFGLTQTGPNAFPSQLYNAMVAPITPYPIKGVIWYQGESNAWEAYRYRKLFPEMITDWRAKWGQQLPFFWVQLANFMAVDTVPSNSEWAELREAQTKTLSLPATGQALAIDIGEANDIHPRNKRDVGYRLALAALKVAYKKDIVHSGPVFESVTRSGNKMILTFGNAGSGLVAKDKYGYLKGFTIAGQDKKFVWAQGYLENGKIVVFNESVQDPVAVRYAWGNNPEDANLYNKEGLPATPFRTDEWPGISQGANEN